MAKTVNWIFFIAMLAFIIASRWIPVSAWVFVALCVSYIGIQVYGSSVLSAQFYLPVLWRGSQSSGAVAITFDDGPVAGRTEKILEILQQHRAPAAFFCIGKRVNAHPQLVQRIHDEGHLVANHSYFHGATFDLQSVSAIAKELSDTDMAIEQATGSRPVYFRPPYGVTNPMVASAVRRGNYTTVGWSIRSFDTVIRDRSRLLARITRSLKGGDIILLHDHGPCTMEILPDLLSRIKSVGLKIVRVDQLLKEKGHANV